MEQKLELAGLAGSWKTRRARKLEVRPLTSFTMELGQAHFHTIMAKVESTHPELEFQRAQENQHYNLDLITHHLLA